MLLQYPLYDLPLHADTASVNDPYLTKSALDGLIKVFLDNNMDLFRLKSVKVDGILDWDVVHTESI